MSGLELIVALGVVVVLGSSLARRLAVAEPVLLVGLGATLTLVPALADVRLPSETVLFVFLPLMLFWEALTSSLRSLRTYLRGVLLLSTVLVVLCAAVSAWVGHLFGLPWTSAWVLGAALAPTDATVVAAMGALLPRRDLAVLRAESLLNDATALVVFAVAVSAAEQAGGATASGIALSFVVSVVGGLVAGAAVGCLAYLLQRSLRDSLLYNAVLVLVPLVAYLSAEAIHASGVLAVVTAGLYTARVAPRSFPAAFRQPAVGFWSVATFLLNGALFALVGVQLPRVLADLHTVDVMKALGLGVALVAALLTARLAFLVASAYIIRLVDRSPRQHALRVSNRARVVSALCGFRGGISLAMALSLPAHIASRDVVLFATAVVVVGTIVVQGMALPTVVRWADLPHDTSIDTETRHAEMLAARAALEALPQIATASRLDPATTRRLSDELTADLRTAAAREDGDPQAAMAGERYTAARLAIVATKRRTVVALRDTRAIDDEVLLTAQQHLDMEELRWSRPVQD